MKIGFTSDCHIDACETQPKLLEERNQRLKDNLSDADIIILAGDMHYADDRYLDWLESVFPKRQVCILMGNHEYYHSVKADCDRNFLRRIVERGMDDHVTLLNPGVAYFESDSGEKVRVIGATMWTDFSLFGSKYTNLQIQTAWEVMNDYNYIHKYGRKYGNVEINPYDVIAWHQQDLEYLRRHLSQPYSGKTVVATHHAPSINCLRSSMYDKPFKMSEGYAAAYAMDLSALPDEFDMDLWIYGHTHMDIDLDWYGVRLTSAQGGYPGQEPGAEHDLPGPGKIVTL